VEMTRMARDKWEKVEDIGRVARKRRKGGEN
jgi:hypothetical protein